MILQIQSEPFHWNLCDWEALLEVDLGLITVFLPLWRWCSDNFLVELRGLFLGERFTWLYCLIALCIVWIDAFSNFSIGLYFRIEPQYLLSVKVYIAWPWLLVGHWYLYYRGLPSLEKRHLQGVIISCLGIVFLLVRVNSVSSILVALDTCEIAEWWGSRPWRLTHGCFIAELRFTFLGLLNCVALLSVAHLFWRSVSFGLTSW